MEPTSLDLKTPSPSRLILPEKKGEQISHDNALDQDHGFQVSSLYLGPILTEHYRLKTIQKSCHQPPTSWVSAPLSPPRVSPAIRQAFLDFATRRPHRSILNTYPAARVIFWFNICTQADTSPWTGSEVPDPMLLWAASVEVYAIAREYQLYHLEELAKEQIQTGGDNLHAFAVIDAVRVAYPCPTPDDVWFPEYIKSKIKAAFEQPAAMMSTAVKIDFADPMSIAKMVLCGMLEVYCEMVQRLTPRQADEASIVKAHPELTPDCKIALQSRPESTYRVTQVLDQSSPPAPTCHDTCDVPRAETEAHIVPIRLPPTTTETKELGMDLCGDEEMVEVSSMKACDDSPKAVPEVFKVDVELEPQPSSVSESKPGAALESSTTSVERHVGSESEMDPVRASAVSDVNLDTQGSMDQHLSTAEEAKATFDRSTASPSKDGDEFWTSMLKRRKGGRKNERRGTVTFEVPNDESADDASPGQGSKKSKKLSGTAPEFVPVSHVQQTTGFTVGSLLVQPEMPNISAEHKVPSMSTVGKPATSYGVEPSSREGTILASVFSPRSDPGTNGVPDLVPPDPKIWGPIGSHLNKSKSSHGLSDKFVAGATLDREQGLTHELTSPKEKWESWGQFFSVARSRRRAMSMSTSVIALPTVQSDADPVANPKTKPESDLWSVVPPKSPFEPVVIDDSHGGARATLDPEPEPTSGVVLNQDDNNDRPIDSPEPQPQHDHPIPRKKRWKWSRRLRALAEEQGLALAESIAQAEGETGGSDVLSQSTADEREHVETSLRDRRGGELRVETQSRPGGNLVKQGDGQEQDPWEFWGAKRSPTSRRSF
ncbi:hypothetical protein V8F33_013914 [Rhypophila sp. PSN 637]